MALIALGETVRLTATVRDQHGSVMQVPVTWVSGDGTVATVDATGLVSSAGNGTVTITATSGSASGTAAVTVQQEAAAVTVAPDSVLLSKIGAMTQLTAEATDANGHRIADAAVTWTSGDDAVATVNAMGLVTAAGKGVTTITAESGAASASATVIIRLPNPRVAWMKIRHGPRRKPALGWIPGETILVDLRWETELTHGGDPPMLALEVGEDRHWATGDVRTEASFTDLHFRYEVKAGDQDADGISILGEALVLPEGSSLRTPEGVDADLDLSEHVIENDSRHRVTGSPVPIIEVRVASYPAGGADAGYLDEERITMSVLWAAPVRIVGVPFLELRFGDQVRPAGMGYVVEFGGGQTRVDFWYRVTRRDHDADGLSIAADALALVNGASIVSADTGEPVQTVLLAEDVITDDDRHRVRPHDPDPGPRVCTVERREALKYVGDHSVVAEWDGTPIRVDIVDNFPPHVTEDDLRELLAPIGDAADMIESSLGYPVIEMGDIVPVPDDAEDGWDRDYDRFNAAAGSGEPLLRREKHQLLAFYLDDDAWFWDHVGGPPMAAFLETGVTSYFKRTMGDWWHDRDDCCIGKWAANGRHGHVIVHEIFHLLGFKHPDEPIRAGVLMAWGSTIAPWLTGSRIHYVAEDDIEVLRCVFPEGGTP